MAECFLVVPVKFFRQRHIPLFHYSLCIGQPDEYRLEQIAVVDFDTGVMVFQDLVKPSNRLAIFYSCAESISR